MPATLLLIIIGIFMIICTIKKPNFFWNNRKAMPLRNLLGDKAVAIIYIIIGIVAIVFGIYGFFNGGYDMTIFHRRYRG